MAKRVGFIRRFPAPHLFRAPALLWSPMSENRHLLHNKQKGLRFSVQAFWFMAVQDSRYLKQSLNKSLKTAELQRICQLVQRLIRWIILKFRPFPYKSMVCDPIKFTLKNITGNYLGRLVKNKREYCTNAMALLHFAFNKFWAKRYTFKEELTIS